MWIFIVTLAAIVIVVGISFKTERNRNRIKKCYGDKSIKEISEANIFAKKNLILFLCITFVGPLPFVFILNLFEGSVRYLFIGLIVVIVVGSVILLGYWWTVEGITRALLKEDSSNRSSDNAIKS